MICALGTSGRWVMLRSRPPSIVSGGRPSSDPMTAPISVSGRITRFIGRRESDASPPITVRNSCAATMPDRSRIVVPELPASSGPSGGSQPAQAAAVNLDDACRGAPDRHAERLQAGERREAVGAGQVAADGGAAVGQGRQHRVTVRDRLVAGDSKDAGHSCRRRHQGGVGWRVRHVAHYNIGLEDQFPFLDGSGLEYRAIRVRVMLSVGAADPIVHSRSPDISAPVSPPPHADARRNRQAPGSQ